MKILILILGIALLGLDSAFAQALHRRELLHESFAVKDGAVRVAFFDADSTLRVSLSGSVSANGPKDVMILSDVETGIAALVKQGYLVAIVSNQGGIAAGAVTRETADAALLFTIESIAAKNPAARIHYYDYAEGNDENRKPGSGMARRLEQELRAMGLEIDWKNTFMVGDSAYKKGKDKRPDGKPGTHFSNADRLLAENLGIPFHEPTDFFGWRKDGIDVFEKADDVRAYLERRGAGSSSCRGLVAPLRR